MNAIARSAAGTGLAHPAGQLALALVWRSSWFRSAPLPLDRVLGVARRGRLVALTPCQRLGPPPAVCWSPRDRPLFVMNIFR
jgi:hypothetical protein